MKVTNERCPLQAECERKCKFVNNELACDYYHANARPGYDIDDQEAKRYSGSETNWDEVDDGEDPIDEEEPAERPINGLMCRLPVDKLIPHPDNPRKDLGDITELAASIKAKGVLQNLTVVEAGDDTYRIIIGHRRHAAAKLAGLKVLPCVIADMTPQEQFETMMVENVQRSDLTVYEQAEGFQMMLDMGGSVEQVAQKTGFSETTVRNRVKLLKLDKKEFRKAEQRGATMTDYLKLNGIKSEERRNAVLKSIGTADFDQKYKEAIRKEKDEQWLQDVIEAIRNADWCEEITAEQRDAMNDSIIKYRYNYNIHTKRVIEKPVDADKLKWYFFVGREQVDMYREITKEEAPPTKAEADKREQLRAEYAEKIGELLAECETMDNDFREMREEFVHQFSQWNTYREEIQAFAIKAWLCRDVASYGYYAKIDREELANMLNIGYDKEKQKIDEQALANRLRVQPEEVLLYVAYLLLEDGSRHWTIRMYDSDLKCSLPKHREDKQLDLLYECLRSLGYEWSSAEQRCCVGDLPQYKYAKHLAEEFQKEVKQK